MPLFEYLCKNCGHEFEFLTSRDQQRPGKCPSCGNSSLEKKLSAFSVNKGAAPKGEACNSCSSGTCPYAGKG